MPLVVRTPDDAYTLAHPRLRDILAEHFNTGDCLNALLTHCANWEEFSSAYIRAYHAQHLARTGRKAELYELIDKRWFYHLTQHTGSYTAFVADAEFAANAAAQEGPIPWYEFLRCSLIIARLVSVSGSIAMAALAAMIHLGQFERALGFAAPIGDKRTRVDAFVCLIRAHLSADASDKCSQLGS